jgi:hypothetical protein
MPFPLNFRQRVTSRRGGFGTLAEHYRERIRCFTPPLSSILPRARLLFVTVSHFHPSLIYVNQGCKVLHSGRRCQIKCCHKKFNSTAPSVAFPLLLAFELFFSYLKCHTNSIKHFCRNLQIFAVALLSKIS